MKTAIFSFLRVAVWVFFLGIFFPASLTGAQVMDELAWKFAYDERDRLTKAIDPAGRETRFEYAFDEAERLRRFVRIDDDFRVVQEFDEDGRLIRMTDGSGAVSYGYDEGNRLNGVQRQGTHAIAYTYDSLDRLSSVQVGDFYRIEYGYDFLGRLSSMKTPVGTVAYEYQTGLGQVVRSLPNGVKTFWKYQANGELDEIVHGFFKNPKDGNYTVLAQYTYQHGPEGRINAIRERSGQGEFTRQYAYDTMGRLTRATGPGNREYRYEYDWVGNRTRAAVAGGIERVNAYDWAGRLTSVNGIPTRYDAGGNLIEATLVGEAREYRYHPDGRLAEARVGDEAVQYGYDGFGRLLSRKGTDGERRFIPDTFSSFWQPLVIEEPDKTRTLVIWDGPMPVALVRGGYVEWLLHDHLGSVRLVTDARGGVVRYHEYDPFGVSEEKDTKEALTPGFTGLFRDEILDGYLTLARAFVPEMGSFLQPDPQKRVPSEALEDVALYAYCSGDPVNWIDRNGNTREPPSYAWAWEFYKAYYTEMPKTLSQSWNAGMEFWRDVWRGGFEFGSQPGSLADQAGRMGGTRYERAVQAISVAGVAAGATLFGGVLDAAWHAPAVIGAKKATVGGVQNAYRSIHHSFHQALGRGGGGHYYKVRISKSSNFLPRPSLGELPYGSLVQVQRSAQLGEVILAGAKLNPAQKAVVRALVVPVAASATAGPALLYRRQVPLGNAHLHDPNDPFELTGKALDSFSSPPQIIGPQRLAMLPSPVGGVYLGGAGGALDGLGMVKGLRLDDNGNLVLIGEEDGEVKLPPLRLDDVVTVFRSVYLHGEGPTVTIDPNPENPDKSAMIIVHSAATRDTYVGWVLYQADRLMKGYTQGVDNQTQQDVVSRVPGYAEVLETIYFGSDDPRKSQQEGIWERFWIVPAAANRFEGPRRELTLFDVPLKVKTQRMKWVNNKLEDDLTGRSSPGAQAFTSWFTNNYDGIAADQYLVPPPEYGISDPAPVFAELRRIALMTAVAEKLRDQGVPMPFWMRDHEVRQVPCEGFTPGLEVTRQRTEGGTIRRARIFGGVELSAESRLVKTYATAADAAKAPPEVRSEMDRAIKLAGSLEQAVEAAVSPVGSPPLTMHSFTHDHRTYQAVALPGAATQALGPCRLAETDLVVPFAGDRDIRLVRRFNSFFDPQGPWGRGWTMDLPRLQEVRIPVSREGSKTTYTTGHELITPLNSFYASFKELRPIKELGGSRLLAPDADGPFHGLADARPDFLRDVETRVLYLKDGQEWHFTRYGDLIAVKEGPQVTGYERRADGRVSRLVGLLGGRQAAQIDLEYDNRGMLTKAVGKSFDSPKQEVIEVTYAYAPSGRLSGATLGEGTVGYEYKSSRVTAVNWTDTGADAKPERLRVFEYNGRGQLLSEESAQHAVSYAIAEIPGGLEASVIHTAGEGDLGFVRYDTRMRPVETREADGTHTAWEYRADGSVETAVTVPGVRKVTVVTSADGRQRTVSADGRPTLVAQFKAGGKLIGLRENQRVLLTQEWRLDGQLARTETESQGVSPQYDEHGLLSSILVHPPGAGQRPAEWQETRVDWRGVPLAVKDYTGLHLQLEYDASGDLAGVVQKTPEGNMGYRVERDGEGRVQTVASSWGNASYGYAANGELQRIESIRGGRSATLELVDGLVRKVTGFDGGVTTFDYHHQSELAGAPRSVIFAIGLKLAYEYDPEGRLRAVGVGDQRRVQMGYDAQGRVVSYAWQARP